MLIVRWLPWLLSLLTGACLLVGFRRTRGSTLQAPLVWTGLSWGFLLATHAIWGPTEGSADAAGMRYLATVSTFCPSMALLGAKRPQDRGWQFVVVTLWIVLALPPVQQWVFSPARVAELHAAWRWFLVLLIAISVANYLPTRHVLPAMAVGAGQLVLLGENGPLPWVVPATFRLNVSMTLFATAICVAARSARRSADFAWDRVWLDFRDSFGAVWALRVMERINQIGGQEPARMRLTWQGFQRTTDTLRSLANCDQTDAFPREWDVGVRSALRRFVTNEWIDARLVEPADFSTTSS